MGAYTVMSIAQGGCGMPFFATAVFSYIADMAECTGVIVEEHEMPEGLLKLTIRKVCNCVVILYDHVQNNYSILLCNGKV